MLRKIQGFGKYCGIAGYRDVKINDAERFLEVVNKHKPRGVEVQFFDADVLATWHHLYFALLNALTVFKNKENICNSLAMETMIYASARRQIRKATQLVGIKPTSSNIAVLTVGAKPEAVQQALTRMSKCIDGQPDESVLELRKEKTERIRKAFDISDSEVETVIVRGDFEQAVVDLVIERVALLSTMH